MTDRERDILLQDVYNKLNSMPFKANQTCSDVVVEHSKLLSSVEQGMLYVKESVTKMDSKIDELVKENKENSTRLTKLETEKKTVVAVATAIGSIILSLFQMFQK